MPIAIKSTKDVKINGIKMVVFGYAGAGKTRLASTAPKPIIISAEHGLLSLADTDTPYIEVNTVKDIGDAFKLLKTNDDFQTIIIDSLSEITEVVVAEFLKDPEVKDPRQAYGKLAEAMMPMIKNFRNLMGKHVVFTSKAKRVEDEYTGRTTIEPMLPGKVVPENLPYMIDELLYLDIDRKGERHLVCNPTTGILAKDRSGKLDGKEPPNLAEIFNKILS
jgi:hypothetical protein